MMETCRQVVTGLANESRAAFSGQPFNLLEALWIVAPHQLRYSIQIKNARVHNDISTGAAVVADDNAVVLAESALNVVEGSLTAVGNPAKQAGIIGMDHVQRQQNQVFTVRALGGHRLQTLGIVDCVQ